MCGAGVERRRGPAPRACLTVGHANAWGGDLPKTDLAQMLSSKEASAQGAILERGQVRARPSQNHAPFRHPRTSTARAQRAFVGRRGDDRRVVFGGTMRTSNIGL